MTLRHLRIFVTVADSGSMRRAAEILYVSQPSVSQAIGEIERHYGILLFDRLSQRIYLTEAGKNLLPYARHILDAFDRMDAYASGQSVKDILRIGGSVSAGTVILPRLVQRLEAENPNADVRVQINNTSFIESQIQNSALDLAIVEGMIKGDEIVAQDLYQDELVMVVGPTHPFFSQPAILVTDLSGQKLISRESGSMERNQFESFLSDHGIHMRRCWDCTNTEAIKQAVRCGQGIAILSSLLVQHEVDAGDFRVLHIDGVQIQRTWKLIYHKNKFFSDIMKRFIRICEEHGATGISHA